MKPSIRHSIAVCLAAFALLLMVACSNQEKFFPEAERGFLTVFTLDLGNLAHGITRATPDDGEYDKGNVLENTINFPEKDFRCYLFGTDNFFVSTLDIVSIQEFGEKIYSIRLRLPDTEEVKNAMTTGCRFVFLANWGHYDDPVPGTTTIADLCASASAEFGFSRQKSVLSADNLIPMYGVKEFKSGVQDFIDGKDISDIGTVHLLRAFAKVEVYLYFGGFAEEPVVTSVSLTHANSKGCKAPKDVTEEGQYVTDSWRTDYTPVNIPDDATDIGDLALTKDESTGHYVAYVPEYRNVNEQGNPLDSRSRIKIGFTIGDVAAGGLHVEQEFDFRYSDKNPPTGVTPGQHFDIARNNWYKFNITAIGKDIVWTVDVIPFTAVELNPDYGLEREKITGYIIGKDSQGRDCWYDGNYYDTATAVPLYLGPTGQEGEAVAINGSRYMLVYADYERTAAMLDHIFDEAGKKYLLYPAGRTGYENVSWIYYLNDLKHPVWLDEDCNEWNVVWNAEKGKDEWVYTVGKWYRTLNEWDRLDWNRAYWDKEVQEPRIYPKFWFDVLGNRYPWSEGDTKEKRAVILGDWVQYLE